MSKKVLIIIFLFIVSGVSLLFKTTLNPDEILLPPSLSHPFGTDDLGRDILLLTLQGTWVTFTKSFLVLIPSLILGLALGVISALFINKLPDLLIIWMAETIRSLPGILIIIVLLSFGFDPYLSLIIFFWLPVWRMFRALFSEVRTWTFYEAAIALGYSRWQALVKHGIPNMLTRIIPLIVGTYSEIIGSFLVIDFLSLNRNTNIPTLGNLLSESMKLGVRSAWVWLPALFLIAGFFLDVYLIINEYVQREGGKKLTV